MSYNPNVPIFLSPHRGVCRLTLSLQYYTFTGHICTSLIRIYNTGIYSTIGTLKGTVSRVTVCSYLHHPLDITMFPKSLNIKYVMTTSPLTLLRDWFLHARVRICKRLLSPGIDSKESILPACRQIGLLYTGPQGYIGCRNRFLGISSWAP